MSRKGRETTKEERALIILLHEQNKSLSTISKMVKRPKSTVQGIISRFGKRKSTENMKRSGRPRKYVEYGKYCDKDEIHNAWAIHDDVLWDVIPVYQQLVDLRSMLLPVYSYRLKCHHKCS